MYKLTVLDNGLKVITSPAAHLHGVTVGVFVGVGSRFESDKLAGISHFAEHMFFKGTRRRPSQTEISRAVESLGGYTNAMTSQEYTCFYNRVPAKKAAPALEILSDMLNNSLFDASAIERERGVILEELNMYLDTPTRYIYDLIMQTVYPGHPLGRDIIGFRQTIKSFQRQDFIDYLAQTYRPRNMAVVFSGQIKHTQALRLAKEHFGQLKNQGRILSFQRFKQSQRAPRVTLYHKKTDQAHLALAVPALPYNHRYEAVLDVLQTVLGVGMSSRLFLEVREKRGLCYYIHTFDEKFKETGLLGVVAGLNLDKLEQAIRAILTEFERLKKEYVTPQELKRAKEYLRGTLSLQLDNTDSLNMWYGQQALFYRRPLSLEEKIKNLLAVTQHDIMKLARRLFVKSALNLAIIGPLSPKSRNKFLKILNDNLK